MKNLSKTIHDAKDEELKISELRYRRLFETAQKGILLVDFNTGIILDVNKFLIDMLGYSKADFLKKHLWEIGVFKDVAASKKNFSILQKKKYLRYENLLLETKTGKQINVEIIANSYRVGSATVIQCNIRDITDRKKAENEIKNKSKELNCLYSISSIIEIPNISLDGIFKKTVNVIPLGWQYVDIACARITNDKDEYKTVNFKKTKWRQTSDIMVYGKRVGCVDVFYLKKRAEIDEGPFLKEERNLIAAIAERLGRVIERKRAEKSLHDSEALHRSIIETTDTGYVIIDKEGRVVDANSKYIHLTGYRNLSEIRGRSVVEWTANYEKKKNAEAVAKCAKDGYIRNLEIDYIDKHGKITPIEINAAVVVREGVPQILALCRDITERKQFEKALQESENRYKTLFTGAPEGILIADLQTKRFRFANPAICRMFGYTEEEFMRLGLADIHPKESLDFVSAEFEAQARGEKTLSPELPCLRKDGTLFYANVNAIGMVLDNHKCNAGFFTDITEHRQIVRDLEDTKIATQNILEDLQVEKEALARAKARDDAILVNIGDGLVAVGKDGNIVLVDRAFETMLGWKESEVQGKFLSQVVPMVDEMGKPVPESERLINKTIKEQDPAVRSATAYYKRKDETFFPVVITVSPIMVGKNFIGAVEIFRDITKEKRVEKLRADFLALASHQLRTPLSGTKWLIETIQRGVLGEMTPRQKDYLSQLYGINERMIRLVSDMLNVLRLESGVVSLKQEVISVSKLYDELIYIEKLAAKEKGWVVIKNLLKNKKDVIVETDVQMLRNILDCFISNAINYSTSGKAVDLDAREEKAFVIFSVKDSGIGIPKEEQGQIFERFYRASNAKVVRPGGTGLGLYTASMLAEKIGGKLSFESEEGKGTTFYLRVPKRYVKI